VYSGRREVAQYEDGRIPATQNSARWKKILDTKVDEKCRFTPRRTTSDPVTGTDGLPYSVKDWVK